MKCGLRAVGTLYADSVPTARFFIENNISTDIPSLWDVLVSKFGTTHFCEGGKQDF